MSIFKEIESDLIGNASLSTALRKAKVIAYSLGNQDFKGWVESELRGYHSSEELPEYRKVQTFAMGNFTNGAWKAFGHQIPLSAVPEEFRAYFNDLHMFQGVAELESMFDDSLRAEKESLRIAIPPEIYGLLSNKVFHNLQCISAWRVLNSHQLARVLDSIRNSLLSFILELAEKYPQIKTDSSFGEEIPNDQIRQVFNLFIKGDAQTIVGTDNQQIYGGRMTNFDQRNQQVETQYNAGGDINFNAVSSSLEFMSELGKLKTELTRLAEVETMDAEVITDVEYQLTKAIQQVSKDEPDQKSILDHLTRAKSYVDGVEALVKVGTAIGTAISVAKIIFG